MENDKLFQLITARFTTIEAAIEQRSTETNERFEQRFSEGNERHEKDIAEVKEVIIRLEQKVDSLVGNMGKLIHTQNAHINECVGGLNSRITSAEKDIEARDKADKKRLAYILASIGAGVPLLTFIVSVILDFVKRLKKTG